MSKTKTILSAGFMIVLLGIIMIGGCKKDSSSSNEDWASSVAGIYTFTNSTTTPPEQTTVNVQKITNKTISIAVNVDGGSYLGGKLNDIITPATLISATTASFSTPTNDCDSAKLNPPPNEWVSYCKRYNGTATFTSNSINVDYITYRTFSTAPTYFDSSAIGPIIAKK